MKNGKVVRLEETPDLRVLSLNVGDPVCIKGAENPQVVSRTRYEDERLLGFDAVAKMICRDGRKDGIKETSYAIDTTLRETGELRITGSRDVYGQDTEVQASWGTYITPASKRYRELNEFLTSLGQ